jgi:hypothetical protein
MQYAADVYDIDLFDNPRAVIDALHQAGTKVVCYFSAGTYEPWRSDATNFPPSALGKPLADWPEERWLDVRSPAVLEVMRQRMDLAKQKGCDAVDTDNVDGYSNNTGLPLTAADQLNYNRALAVEAHGHGLAIGLKNDLGQAAQLEPDFDFSINEQCHVYNECDRLGVFAEAGKAIFNIEYDDKYRSPTGFAQLCAQSRAGNMRTLVLPLALDGSFRMSCD